MITLTLPYPPSVNHYYLRGRILSDKAKAYRKEVYYTVPRIDALKGPLRVDMDVYPRSRRRYDVDNLAKATLDALTNAGIWADDSQVVSLCITKRDVVKGGQIVLRVSRWEQTDLVAERRGETQALRNAVLYGEYKP